MTPVKNLVEPNDHSSSILVSIVIPVHNRWDLTSACLASIADCTPESHEIIIIDDNSDPEEAAHLDALGSCVTLIRNSTRQSYSFNNNQAAKIAKGKYLCLLNNDTIVTGGWLSALLIVAEREERVGVIGNKHLFPDNKLLHHCGIAFDSASHPWHISPHTDPELPAANYQRDLQAVSFACAFIPKDVYLQLGGLKEEFKTSYEDCDFCLRAGQAGLRVIYTPASVIYHYGQSTPGRKVNDAANKQVFLTAWNGLVDSDLPRINREDQAYNNHEAHRPRLRIKEETGIHLAFDLSQGNSFAWVAAELALALKARGEKVSLPFIRELSPSFEPEKAAQLKKLMRISPYRSAHVKLNHYWGPYLRQPIYGEINAEFFLTNYRFRTRPGDIDSWMKHVVASGIRKLAPSPFCKDCLVDVGVPENDIGMVPLGYSPEIDKLFPKDAPLKPRSRELKLLAITNSHDLYRMGSDILIKALAEAFGPNDPVVIHIHDYGAASGNRALKDLVASYKKFPRVFWHEEFLPKDELLKFCSSMDAVLAPFRGEGFSMKVLDCMALGVPVLMPSFSGVLEFAAPGTFVPLPYKEVPMEECYDTDHFHIGPGAYWCEVEHQGFVNILKQCLSNPEMLEKTAKIGREHVRGRFSWDSAAKSLVNVLNRWSSERMTKVSIGRCPSTKELSVVIPTKNRGDKLAEALDGYRLQTLKSKQFEVILVNDHGDMNELAKVVAPFQDKLNLTVIDNKGPSGPANARNLGMRQARGEIVYITGDDVIPTPDLLEKHVNAHKEFPTLETGFFGRCPWHPAMEQNWLTDHLIGDGGQQFNYRGLKDKEVAPFDRLFTSNVSLKRAFIAESETVFDPIFRYAALEDIEAAYRLHLRGLELRFLDRAVGLHRHPLTVASFLERQRKVGRMLTTFCFVQPAFAPQEHSEFLRSCDIEYQRRRLGGAMPTVKPPSAEELIAIFARSIESIDAWEKLPNPTAWQGAQFKEDYTELLGKMKTTRLKLFDSASEVIMRVGMAEEWALDIPERQFAKEWALAFGFARLASSMGGFHFSAAEPVFGMNGNGSSLEHRYREWFANVAKTPGEALTYLNHEIAGIGASVETLSTSDRRLNKQVEVMRTELEKMKYNLNIHENWISSFSLKRRAFLKFGKVKNKLRSVFGG